MNNTKHQIKNSETSPKAGSSELKRFEGVEKVPYSVKPIAKALLARII